MLKRFFNTWFFQVSAIFVVHYLTGYFGQMLALPPGYASLAWPPFGISIAALLLFGINRWPGVMLGAFVLNTNNFDSILDFVVPLGISLVSTITVIISALCIRKFLNFPKRFYSERDLIAFLFLSGPIPALLSATLGVAILYFNEIIFLKNLMMNWIYWFVGDAIGGIIFAPLALMLSAQSRSYWIKSVTKVVLPVCTSFALILLTSKYLTQTEQEKYSSEFNRKAEFTFNALEKDLNSNVDMLISLKSFFDNSTSVTRDEFRDFAHVFHARNPEIQALAWIPYQDKNSKTFHIEYIEPSLSEVQTHIDNFGTYENRRELMDRAFAQKKIVASSPVGMSESNQNIRGMYLMLAIGRPKGVLLEILRLDGILKDLTEVLSDPSYRVRIQDISDPNARQIMIDTLVDPKIDYHADFKWTSGLSIGDRKWQVSIQQDTSLSEGSKFDSTVFLMTSLIFIFLICALLLTIANRIITVEEIVDEKTQHLKDLNLQLKKASETKSEFLANMSHEIRTPLNVIVGMSDLLEDSGLNEEQKHFVDISKKSSQTLLNIISDILDISKIEAGLITLEKTDVNLHSLITDITEMFELNAQEKGLQLTLDLDSETDAIYLGDPTRIRQILSNLISNSLKFTNMGSVHVELKKNQTSMKGNLIFTVTDTGIGIPEEKIPQLFQPFTQADSTITRKFGGTGLGLSISKRLVTMMNGEISLQSTLNQGSRVTFTLELPWLREVVIEKNTPQEDHNKIRAHLEQSQEKPLSILIVDDTDDNRLLVKAYLKNTPHQMTEANNGLQAFEMAQTQHFDVILMDMQMPVMDGFTATQKIRSWEVEHNQPATAIWALTAYALKNEIDRSLAAGCNLHLIKPLRKAVLLNHIHKLSKGLREFDQNEEL